MCGKRKKDKEEGAAEAAEAERAAEEDRVAEEVERLRARHAAVSMENAALSEEIDRGERDANAYRRNMRLLAEYWQTRGGPHPPPSQAGGWEDGDQDDTGGENERRAGPRP